MKPRILLGLIFILLAVCLTGCGLADSAEPTPVWIGEGGEPEPVSPESPPLAYELSPETWEPAELPDPEGYYYDLEGVVLYLEAYDALPPNYLTKAEARQLGWEGGSVEAYQEGAAIGGDRFGNREGLLPQSGGRQYTECDLNTDGQSSRGAERLVFSNDGLYFYTGDHYESFSQVWVQEGQVTLE